MSTMSFASGSPIVTAETALGDTTLASLARAGAPVVVARCEPLAVVAMNEAAAGLFGASFEIVSRRLFQGTEPGARRLAFLARTLLPGAAPRLERMRFYFGAAGQTLTFLCRRVASPDGELLVLAVPGIRTGLVPNAAPAVANESAPDAPPPAARKEEPQAEHAEQQPERIAGPPDELHFQAETGEPAAAVSGEAARTRFVWRTDHEHRLLEATPPLWTMLRSPVHVTGRIILDILAESGVETARLAAALSAGKTFSGLMLEWPALDGRPALVEIGGIPVSDARHSFAGFRGFALARGARPESTQAPRAEHTHDPQAGHGLADPDPGPGGDPAPSVEPPPVVAEAPPQISPEALVPPAAPAPAASNVVPLRPAGRAGGPDIAPGTRPDDFRTSGLTPTEQNAFDEIARALAGALSSAGDEAPAPLAGPPASADGGALRNLQTLVDLVPIGILVSRGGVVIFANRTLLDLTGFADADALHDAGGLDFLFGGADVGRANEDVVAVAVRTVEGDAVPVDARIHAIAWDGLPATLISLRSARDRTAAARVPVLERSLRERETEARELQTILDTATDGVAILDDDANILALNRSAEALFGRDSGQVAGQPFASLVDEDSRAALDDYLAGLRGGGVASLLNDGREILCRGPRDGFIPVFVTIGRLELEESPKLFAVLRDLTAWKDAERGLDQARQDAERASAQKSEFLARISHEIRTPLNAILGFAEVIMDERFGPVGNDRYRDYMQDIHRSGEHVMSLVNDLLDLSKIEAGKMDMTFTAVDANSCVSDCVSLMQPQASRARVIVRLSLAPHLPKVIADERAFKQIVLNILSNALKYNETGGQVIVSTARTDAGHAVVRIRDTGVGMSESDMQIALEPFGQISTSRTTTGTGLGLPLTKALVEANRASFTIKSRKGEGTLVEVAFPPSRVMAE